MAQVCKRKQSEVHIKKRAKKQKAESSGENTSETDSDNTDSSDEDQPTVGRAYGAIPPVPRTGHVSDKIKKQIRKGEVVNLALLKPKSAKDKNNKKIKINFETGRFEEEEISQEMPFYEWLECFLIFFSIRVEYYPKEVQGLLRHIQNVQQLHTHKRDAVEYDLQFRATKYQHPTIEWGEYLGEIVDALPVLKSKKEGKTGSKKPTGICFKFNTSNGCSWQNCRWQHICRQCKGVHSVINCKNKN